MRTLRVALAFRGRTVCRVGMRYKDAYAKAHPFDKLVEGMLQSEMVFEVAGFMQESIENGVEISILINNRAGGNAPIIAQKVAEQFFENLESD